MQTMMTSRYHRDNHKLFKIGRRTTSTKDKTERKPKVEESYIFITCTEKQLSTTESTKIWDDRVSNFCPATDICRRQVKDWWQSFEQEMENGIVKTK